MNHELFKLCQDVYKRTEWDSKDLLHKLGDEVFYRELFDSDVDEEHPRDSYHPLYTSDFLLKKLKEILEMWTFSYGDEFGIGESLGTLKADIGNSHYNLNFHADTALEALLKLVIALDDAKELK